MRKYAKIDKNQTDIVEALKDAGAIVQSIATIGNGCPDLLVGFRGVNYVFEVKDPLKPPSKRTLTDDELAWHAKWRGQVNVILDFRDAMKVLMNQTVKS